MRTALSILALVMMSHPAFAQEGAPAPKLHLMPQQAKCNLVVGQKITDFELNDIGGKPIKTAELRQNKYFIIRLTKSVNPLWAKQSKDFRDMLALFPDKLAVLDILVNESAKAEDIGKLYDKAQLQVSIGDDRNCAVAEKLGCDVFPVVLVFDRDGQVILSGRTLDLKAVKTEIEMRDRDRK